MTRDLPLIVFYVLEVWCVLTACWIVSTLVDRSEYGERSHDEPTQEPITFDPSTWTGNP